MLLYTEIIIHICAREFKGISRLPATYSGTSVAPYGDVGFGLAAKQPFVCKAMLLLALVSMGKLQTAAWRKQIEVG